MITYPRSGANYLQNLLFNKTGKHIPYSHTIDYINEDNSIIIAIARDPFDSIHSHVTMKKHYYPEQSFNHSYVAHYNDIYTFSYHNADIVIDYRELIKNPDKVLLSVCSVLGFEENSGSHALEILSDKKEIDYLVSSKTSKEYKNKHFTIEEISDCYEPYHKLLSRAIDLTNYSH